MPEVIIEQVSYGTWENCVRITNNIVDLTVTADVGPRIIRYGFCEKENEMCEIESTRGMTGGEEWRIYGGHRLWHSPESQPRTYEPDNFPIQWQKIPGGIRTVQDIEQLTHMKKEMEIVLSPDGSMVQILHRIVNKGLWPVELSVWSISAMASGGKEVIPLAAQDTGLLPNRNIAVWPYSKLNDPRVKFGEKYIVLTHDPGLQQPFKLGVSNENGWAAYFNNNHLFIKHYIHDRNASYPDFGVSYESYMNDFMLEMETLSPLVLLKPDGNAEHIEKWQLFDNVPMPQDDEALIEEALKRRSIREFK
jgi:hypothetical protein